MSSTLEFIKKLFVIRDDCFTRQYLIKRKGNPNKAFARISFPLTDKEILDHLKLRDFIGTYQLRASDNFVKWGCWDFDENTPEDEENAKKLFQFCKEKGVVLLPERSGGGKHKIHLWLFSKDPVPAEHIKIFMEKLQEEAGVKAHKLFPKQTKLKPNGFGNFVKLPLGKHLVTKNVSVILNQCWEEERDVNKNLKWIYDNRNKIPKPDFKKQEKKNPKHKIHDNADEFDRFFNYVLKNELPEGISVSEKSSGGIEGINSNVLKNEAIWFLKKGYTEARLIQEIKPLFDKNGWAFGDLKGWFRKAVNKEIIDINKGELIEWCKTYASELLSLFDFKKYLEPADIIFKTDHLQYFDDLNDSVKLEGKVYSQIKKQMHYHLISMAIPKNLKIVEIGNIKVDTREHPAFFLPSGKGKAEIKNSEKRILLKFNPEINIKEPRSIHKEQLVGKILKRKVNDANGKLKEVIIKKEGFLSSDLLILEEAHEVFNSSEKNDIDIRDSLTIAADIYGENLIQKQAVDNLDTKEETLSYYPKCSILSFCQPLIFRESFATKGLMRRLSVVYQEFPSKTSGNHFANRLLKTKISSEKSEKKFAEYLKKISQVEGVWSLNKDGVDFFIKAHVSLLDQGFLQGGKIYAFTKILEYPMQNQLLKMSAIRAISNFRTEIMLKDIQEAFVDILERFTFELLFVKNKVQGSLDYGSGWGGAIGKEQECLKWLYEKGAISKEQSDIYIATFQKVIADKFDISPRRANARYQKMKQEGIIADKRGQGKDNCVWIKIKPKLRRIEESRFPPKNLYFELVKSDMSDMTPETGLHNKLNKKVFYSSEFSKKVDNSLDVISDISDISEKEVDKIIELVEKKTAMEALDKL